MSETVAWQRPKTTRRYIHPPKAERMFTLWAEGKIIFGEVVRNIDHRSYKYLDCSGIWLLHGDDEQFDFRTCKNRLPENGIPVHGLTNCAGGIETDIETFCSIERKPTCFIRLTFKNSGTEPVSHPFALLLRTGRERELVFASPDVYSSYAPEVQVWKDRPATWYRADRRGSTVLVDEYTFLTAQTPYPYTWDEKKGALRFDISLAPDESAEFYLAFGKGDVLPFDYEQEKKKTVAFWQRELARLELPDGVKNEPEMLRTVQNLTVQLLQCFCYQVGENHLLARQGGLQRLIWPWESLSGLEALSRLGDFGDYIEPVLEFYFTVLQIPTGEVRPLGEGWASITASALYSFSRYCRLCSSRTYSRWRDHAMAAFDWIKHTRASTAGMDGVFEGLFPPLRACDWGQQFQSWMFNDIINLDCLREFAELTEEFGDPRAAEIRAEYEDYFAVMRRIFARFEKEAEGSDCLRIPLCPDGNDAQLLKDCYPYITHGLFTCTGVVRKEDIPRVKNQMVKDGLYKNGLYGHMPQPNGNPHIWYTSIPDYYWFLTWMMAGEREEAKEVLDAQISYSMTDEYYMIERFADNDPYFLPWSPNASASGRTLLMIADLYGKD